MLKLILIYFASYVGCRIIIRFLKERKMIDASEDHPIACLLLAPMMFIGLLITTLCAFIAQWTSKKQREDEFVNKYNKKLPEVWYKLNRFLGTGKPSILDNADTFDKQYDKYIEEQDLFSDFKPYYGNVTVVKSEATQQKTPKDLWTSYHEATGLIRELAVQTQRPIVTVTQQPKVQPVSTRTTRKSDPINDAFTFIIREKCRGY